MKKLSILIILLILTTFISGCGTTLFDLNSWILPDDLEFLAMIQELDTPEKICQYMADNFEYEKHFFYSYNPYTIWQTKKADCKDYAVFGQFIANYHGYETYLIKINCHWLAVYKENQYSFSDNWRYYSPIYDTFSEIVEYDFFLRNKIWSKYFVYDYDMNIIETGYNN